MRKKWVSERRASIFQSKLFLRLFFSYILVIVSFMVLCISFLLFENNQISKIQMKRSSEIQLDEVSNLFMQRIMAARNIVQNLSYSTTMKQLYMSTKTGRQLDSYALFSIQSEMSNTMASGGLSIYQTVLFVDDSNKAYSSGGVISLSDSYVPLEKELPCMVVGTVNETFQLSDTKRYSFNQEFLLYCDDYTYQNGSNIGTMCILFDLKSLENDMKNILDKGYGMEIYYEDNVIFSLGETSKAFYTKESSSMPGIVYTVYASKNIASEVNRYFYFTFLGIIVISIVFLALAYGVSRKYYMPIDHLEQMVSTGQNASKDEMETIIRGIEDLIGEKNAYREKMLTITPYAKTGILHSMIAGNVAADHVGVFLDENYLDLIKPYFIVSAVNFAFDTGLVPQEEKYRRKIEELFNVVTEIFSTDELHIVYYFRDVYNVFLIINFENEREMDELFHQIHRYISTATAKDYCYVTMGVDAVRDDIGELKDACEGAVRALYGILTDGRGAVYFLEDMEGTTNTYYFPVNFREKLKRCLQKQDEEEIHTLLFDIYKTNSDMAGTPEMYLALVDEFHLSVIKTLREITGLNTVHLNIKKYTGLATLQDIFDYYDAALLSVINTLHDQSLQEDSRLEEDIVSYIDAHYCDADLSLQSLSDRFNVSNKYLSLLCKECFGVTYLQYIQTKRIRKAEELLRERQYTLTEVCAMCGYTNQLTFRRNFKSITGVNPSTYQEKQNER